jgi:hypothetical protein
MIATKNIIAHLLLTRHPCRQDHKSLAQNKTALRLFCSRNFNLKVTTVVEEITAASIKTIHPITRLSLS